MSTKLEIPVEEFSSPIQAFATPEMGVEEMFDLIKEKGFRHLPVLKNKKPIGIISIRDLEFIKNLNRHFDLKAEDIMTNEPYCIPLGSTLEEVAFHMSEKKIGSAIVLNDDGEADSIFTSIDGLNALVEISRGEL